MTLAWGQEHDEAPDPGEPIAWQRYDLETDPNGRTISGTASTNDDNDDGYPDPELSSWRVVFRDREEMLQRTGGSHVGVSGVVVTVILDGQEIER